MVIHRFEAEELGKGLFHQLLQLVLAVPKVGIMNIGNKVQLGV